MADICGVCIRVWEATLSVLCITWNNLILKRRNGTKGKNEELTMLDELSKMIQIEIVVAFDRVDTFRSFGDVEL